MKKFIALLSALLLMSFMVACNKSAENGDAAGTAKEEVSRPFVVGSTEFNGDFYVGWTNSSYDAGIRSLVWRFGILEQTPQGELVDSPLIAEKTVSDDLKTWTFKIVDGAKFQNGEALSASDIKFTYDFYMDKDALTETGGSSTLHEFIDSVDLDEATNTVTFNIKTITYTIDNDVFTQFILPEETIKEGAKKENCTVQQYVKAHISEPIGYGPYKMDEYKEAQYVKLSAFDGYLGKAPKIKNIIVKVVPPATELDQLMQGEVDMLTMQVEAEKINAAKADPNYTFNDYYRHGGGCIILHCDFGPTQITEVRQAFAYVVNRPKIIELFLGEYGIASNGKYSKNQWMMYDDDEMDLVGTAAVGRFESSLKNYDILDADGKFDEDANIAKASELLSKAAAKTDGAYAKITGNANDGFMWEGKPLEIKVTYDPFWSDTYNMIFNETYLAKLPFKVSLTGLDFPVEYSHWTGNTEEQRMYHAFVGGEGYSLKENPRVSFHTDKILPWGQPSDNGSRFSGGSSYTPAEWDALLEKIQSANPLTGRDEYRKNWREFVRVSNEEVFSVPVYSNNYFDLYTVQLENFKTNALWDWSLALPLANWKK